MSPERLAYFSECVRRHTNIVPSLAAEALAHIQAQAAAVERLTKLVEHCAEGFESVRSSNLQRAHDAANEMLVIIRASPLGLSPHEAEDLNFLGQTSPRRTP